MIDFIFLGDDIHFNPKEQNILFNKNKRSIYTNLV